MSPRGAQRAPLEPLLQVQQRRVDRAVAQVRDANQRVLERQREREAARERWRHAEAARRREMTALERRSVSDREADAAPSGEDLDAPALLAHQLAQASSALDWCRARVEEARKALETAALDVTHAQAALAETRRQYGQQRARHEALFTLARARRQEEGRAQLRNEECAIEDLLNARLTEARRGSRP